MGLVYRTDVVALSESCSIYTCKLTMVEKDDVNLQYTISGLSVEYGPIDAERRSPKRDASHLSDGGNGFGDIKLANKTVLCSGTGCEVGLTGPTDRGNGGDPLDKLIRLSTPCESLFAQLRCTIKCHLRLKRILLTSSSSSPSFLPSVSPCLRLSNLEVLPLLQFTYGTCHDGPDLDRCFSNFYSSHRLLLTNFY